MAVAYRGMSVGAVNATTGTVTFTDPGTAGDLLFAVFDQDGTVGWSTSDPGWTSLGLTQMTFDGQSVEIWYKKQAVGGGGSIIFTGQTPNAFGPNPLYRMAMFAYSGADATNPINVLPVGIQVTAGPQNSTWTITSPSVTTTVNGCMLASFIFTDQTDTGTATVTALPTGYTQRDFATVPTCGFTCSGLADKTQSTAGATGTAVWTVTLSSPATDAEVVGYMVAIAPAGSSPPDAVPFVRQQLPQLTADDPPVQRRARLVVNTPGPPGPLPFKRDTQTDVSRRAWDPPPLEEAVRRRALLVVDTPAVSSRVPFSRTAHQQALSQWVETPSGIVIPQRLARTTLPVPVPGLVQWFRSDLDVTVDPSGGLLGWGDHSGHGNDATAVLATSPLWTRTGTLNGYPTVSFAPTWFMSGTTNPVPAGAARTCIAVMKSAAGTTGGPFKFRSSTPVFEVMWISAGGSNGTDVYTDGVSLAQAIPAVDYNRTTILEIGWDGNTAHNVTARLNNGAQTVSNVLGSGTASDTGGSGFQIGVGFNNFFYEWLVFDHVLTEPERAALFDSYLGPRYNVPSEQVPPFSRAAHQAVSRSAWELDAPPRFERRLVVPAGTVLPDSPVPGWNRRISDAIARAAWEAGAGLPELLAKSAANSPAAPPLLSRAGLAALLAQWDPGAWADVQRRRSVPSGGVLPDSPPVGWPRRLVLPTILRAWETPDPMPPALRRSGIDKPPPPASFVLTPPLQALIDDVILAARVDSRELTVLVDELILSLIGQ